MPDGSLEVVSVFDCVRVYRDEWLDFCVEVGDGLHGKLRKSDVNTVLRDNSEIVPAELRDALVAWADFDFQEFLKGL